MCYILIMTMREQIGRQLNDATRKLYDPCTPDSEREYLSMRVSMLRQKYARALRVTAWTATAALESAGGEEEAT